ncbi:MAG: lipoprotein [Idiomarina sp.]
MNFIRSIGAATALCLPQRTMKKAVLIAVAAFALAGCNQQPHVDQSNLCIYSNDEEAKQCKTGEMAWYKPNRWGNEQLPLSVAGAYCDFNYEVMYNNAGVICVFTDKRMELVN